ncbi:MAG: hypothetical protein WC371_05860, partial [Parachlamydiales bacterium]
AVFNSYSGYSIIQCGKISRAWKKTKKIAKKHKKAIIIGAVVIVAVAAVTAAVAAASSAGVAAASSAAGAAKAVAPGSNKSKPNGCSASNSSGSQDQRLSNHDLTFQSMLYAQIASFKENIAKDFFFRHPSGRSFL